jgi:hypothetical protein
MTIELHDIRSEVLVAELFCDAQLTDQQDGRATVMADAVIAQVIQLKDPGEPIPGAVWWRVAEVLRACTTATSAGSHLTALLIEHAFADVDDVLSALSVDTADAVDASRARSDVHSERLSVGGSGDALAATRTCCLRLARLLFSLDPTTPAQLATRVNQLRRALAGWHVEVLETAAGLGQCLAPALT